MPTITLEAIEAKQTELSQLIAERNALRAQIEASQKQEPVAWVTDTEFDRETEIRSNSWRQKYSAKITATGFDTPLYAAPVLAPDVLKDAQRLDWLDKNIFNRENLDWITKKVSHTENMWVMFAPVGVQGSARAIIDAAMGGANE